MVIVRLERTHFSFIQTSSGVLWFFFCVSFFTTWIFWKLPIVLSSPQRFHHLWFCLRRRSGKVIAAISHWNAVCGSSGRPYFHSVGLFSHDGDAVPPSQPPKCQMCGRVQAGCWFCSTEDSSGETRWLKRDSKYHFLHSHAIWTL